jgi:hypothetical protein
VNNSKERNQDNMFGNLFQLHIVLSPILAHFSDMMLKNTINWYKLNEIHIDKISELFSTLSSTSLPVKDLNNGNIPNNRLNNQPLIIMKFKVKFYFLIHDMSLSIEKIEKIEVQKVQNKDKLCGGNFDMKVCNLFVLSVKSIICEINNMSEIKNDESIDGYIHQSMGDEFIFESSKLDLIFSVGSVDLDHVRSLPGGVCKLVGRFIYDIYIMYIYLYIHNMYLIYTYMCICILLICLYVIYMGVV